MNAQIGRSEDEVVGEEHWTQRGDTRLFLWEKFLDRPNDDVATLKRPQRRGTAGV